MWLVVAAGTAGIGLPACGDNANYPNAARPAAPATISGAVSAKRVSLSPRQIGAGPVRLIVANISSDSLDVSLEPVQAGGGPAASSGPINPGGTATIAYDAEQGTYRVSAKGSKAQAATLSVGAPRASAQDTLQLP